MLALGGGCGGGARVPGASAGGRGLHRRAVASGVLPSADLDVQHERALALGARLLCDHSHDPEEPLRVYADPAGHPFCIFVAASQGMQ